MPEESALLFQRCGDGFEAARFFPRCEIDDLGADGTPCDRAGACPALSEPLQKNRQARADDEIAKCLLAHEIPSDRIISLIFTAPARRL